MNEQVQLSEKVRPDSLLAGTFALFATAGFAVPLFLGRVELAILASYVVFPLLACTLFYTYHRRRTQHDTKLRSVSFLDSAAFRASIGLFFVGQGVSFVLLRAYPTRPITYYAVIAFLATIIFIQIIDVESTPRRSSLILAEIGILLLNVLWGVTFKYHYYFGRTDLFPHSWFVEQVYTTQRVPESLGIYQFHPLWHILGAIELDLLGLDIEPRYVLYVTSGIAAVAAILGVYTIARQLLDSEPIALTAALVTAMSTFFIQFARYSIARSIVSVLLLVVLLATLRYGHRYLVLLALVTLGIIVYHPVSTPFVMVVLGTVYLLQFGFRKQPIIRLHELVVVTGLQVVYWILIASPTMTRFLEILSVRNPAKGGGTVSFNAVPELLNYLSFSVLLLFVSIGALVALSNRDLPAIGRAGILTGLVLVGVTFPGPLQLLDTANLFNFLRFGQYTYPFISIAAATGIIAVATTRSASSAGRNFVPFLIAVLLIFSMSFFAVSNDFAASDNPIVERDGFYTFFLTEEEENSFQTLASVTDGFVYADQITCKYLNNGPYAGNCHITEADLESGRFLAHSDGDVFLVRTTELERRPVTMYPTDSFRLRPAYHRSLVEVGASHPVWGDHLTRNRIYASKDVVGYASGDAGGDLDRDEP